MHKTHHKIQKAKWRFVKLLVALTVTVVGFAEIAPAHAQDGGQNSASTK